MKREDLFQAMNEIDDSLLDENVIEVKRPAWISVAIGAAACIAVTVGVLYAMPRPMTASQDAAEENIILQSPTSETETVTETEAEIIETEEEKASDYCLYIGIPNNLPDEYNPYDAYYLPDDEDRWPVMAEIEIDEANGHVSLMTAYDSQNLPHVGVLTKTDTGYACQINGTDFTLDDYHEPLEGSFVEPMGRLFIFHAENHPLDGMIFTNQIQPYQPFADIRQEDISEMKYLHDETMISAYDGRQIPETLAEMLRNITIYTRTLCHETSQDCLSITIQEDMVYEIIPTTNYLIMNDMIYHTDPETLQKIRECQQIMEEAFQQTFSDTEETVPETTTEPIQTTTITTTTETSQNRIVEQSVPVNGKTGAINLPNLIDEDTTQPEPVFIDEDDPAPSETIEITEPSQPPETITATTEIPVTEPIEEPTEIISGEIPDEVLDALVYIPDDGVYCEFDEPHIEIEPTSGIYKELYLSWALKYYPDEQYVVQIHMYTGTDSTLEEKEQILRELGIRTFGECNGRTAAYVTREELEMLDSHKEYGFLIDLMPLATVEIFDMFTEIDGIVYAREAADFEAFNPGQKTEFSSVLNYAQMYYPEKKFAIQLQCYHNNIASMPDETELLLLSCNIKATGFSDNWVQAVVTAEELRRLADTIPTLKEFAEPEISVRIDLMPW